MFFHFDVFLAVENVLMFDHVGFGLSDKPLEVISKYVYQTWTQYTFIYFWLGLFFANL